MTYSITAEGLVKRFGSQGATVALDGIDLCVPTGSVFGLLGPNGAGKTTAVRILATLLRPDGGHAAVCGHDVVTRAHQVRQLTGLQAWSKANPVSGTSAGHRPSISWLAVTGWPGCRASMTSRARSLAPATSTICPWSPSVRTSSGPSIATCTSSILPD
jgi:ABC-type cobalamin/Fe3+-siderophores transport system ATPase subunit